MRGLADFLSALLRLFQQWARLVTDLTAWQQTVQAQPARLSEVSDFGSNPGNLRMLAYVPDRLASSPALVVVLHGCLQTAAGYDYGAGWSTLADRYGLALLFPEQQQANNPQRCFASGPQPWRGVRRLCGAAPRGCQTSSPERWSREVASQRPTNRERRLSS